MALPSTRLLAFGFGPGASFEGQLVGEVALALGYDVDAALERRHP